MNYKIERITKLIACDDEFCVGEKVKVTTKDKEIDGTITGIGDRYLTVAHSLGSAMLNYSDIDEICRTWKLSCIKETECLKITSSILFLHKKRPQDSVLQPSLNWWLLF